MPDHTLSPFSEKVRARFWAKVDRSGGPAACWPWIGTLNGAGYGSTSVRDHSTGEKVRGAHRVAWVLTNGPIPDGLWALHHCDNRPCCNPNHLFLGTRQDNHDDMNAKGRGRPGTAEWMRSISKLAPPRRGEFNGATKHPERYSEAKRGEKNPGAKLTREQVQEIRRLYAAGGVTLTALGVRFGVTISATSAIVKGKSWPDEYTKLRSELLRDRKERKEAA